MTMRPHRRKAHVRRTRGGRFTPVREATVWRETSSEKKSGDQRKSDQTSKCPKCGALIIARPMPGGGWAHFEGGKGLKKIKHACFNRGAGMSRKRDDVTKDLFDDWLSEHDPEAVPQRSKRGGR